MSFRSTDAIAAQASSWSPQAEVNTWAAPAMPERNADPTAGLSRAQLVEKLYTLNFRILALEERTKAASETPKVGAPLHEALAKYHGDATPMGVAYRLWKHLSAMVESQVDVTDAINRLLNDQAALLKVTLASEVRADPARYTSDGIELSNDASPQDPWSLLGKAADALTANYQSVPEAERAGAPPGLYAMRTAQLVETRREPGLVHKVANATVPLAEYAAGIRLLKQPTYLMVVDKPEMPNGVPVGTGELCNTNVPGALSIRVLSLTDNKVKTKTILLHATPRWQLTNEGKYGLIAHIYKTMSARTRAMGDSQAEFAAAAMHRLMLEEAQVTASLRAPQHRMSHA